MITLLMSLVIAIAQVQVTRVPPPEAAGVITGRVVATDGHPVAGAQVMAMDLGRGMFNRRTSTDADGRYELTRLAAGRYRIQAVKAGFLAVEYGQQRPFEPGVPVAMAEGGRAEGIDIVLAKHSAIVGHVYDDAGDPVEGASVRVSQIAFIDGSRRLVDVPGAAPRLTDDRGRFRVWGLPPGRFIVSAVVGQVDFPGPGMIDMPGYATTFYPGTATPGGAALVDVGLSTDVTGIDFSLVPAPTARVYGQTLSSSGDPITGGVTMRSSQRSGGVATEVGAIINMQDGTFIFPNVPPGEYVIQASRSRVNRWTEGEFASRIVQVSGVDVRGVELRTSAGSQMTGHVTIDDPAGSLSPSEIELTPRPADLDRAPADAGAIAHAEIRDDWTFAVAGLNGPRRLRLTSAPPGWMLKAVLLNGSDMTDEVMEFGTARQSLRDVEVVLTRAGAEIAGTVLDANGAPALDASVIVFPMDNSQWYPDSRFLKMVAQRNGAFDVTGLPAGDYYVAAVNRLTGDEWQDRALLEQLSSEAAHVFATEGQKVTASPKLIVR